MPPIIVNGVEVVEFCHRSLCARACVVFGAAEVRIPFEEYRCKVVRIKRIFGGVRAPVEYARDFSASGKSCVQKRSLNASVEVESEFVERKIPVIGLGDTVFRDCEALCKSAWAVEIAIGILVIKE